ncbi:MAG: Gfo/Idh/MocA family oxidoreductase [Ktedonobacteraceae bacterium]|nr:Gfo/Idh/MocA family oxidoreductase [Ktedonobacteraceae bacterium]
MTDKHQNDPIRVGVIGLGFAGETALKCYSILPNVQIVALAGLEEERLAQLGATFAIPHLYSKYEDLLARDDLDAVSIGVPNHLHAPVAIAALERGLHVLCEKPLARTSTEATAIVQAASKANRVLQVVFNHRERNDVQTLKRYLDEGQLGEIYYAKAYWMRRQGIPGAGSWFVNKEMAGGGPLIDLGSHVLDMALYLLDEPSVVTVSASTYNKLGMQGVGIDPRARKSGANHQYEVEDLATAFLRLSNGATLLLESSWATYSSAQNDYGIVLYGTKGGAELRVRNYNTENTLTIFKDVDGAPTDIHPTVQGGGFHNAVVSSFIDKIVSGNWSLYDGSEGLRRVRVIDACYDSAAQGKEVTLTTYYLHLQ